MNIFAFRINIASLRTSPPSRQSHYEGCA